MVRMLLVGSDHQLVPPSQLTGLSRRSEAIQARLLELKEQGIVRGAVLLSTCNRVEALLELEQSVVHGFARVVLGCDAAFPVRSLDDAAAVEHLLAVACGLQSMAFGEEQVLGQVRQAFRTAEEFGLLSRRLHMLRSRLLSAARELRHRTGLDQRPRSVAAMAVDQVLLAGPRIAVVGAGETGRLVLEIMRRRGASQPLVVNRTPARAEALARHFGGETMALRDFLAGQPPLDAVIFAVRSAEPLLCAARARAQGLKAVADISQPSVLAADLRSVPGLQVCDLDDLARISTQQREHYAATRDTALHEVHALAAQVWQEVGHARPNLGRVVDLHVEGALAELEQAFHGRLGHLSPADREAVRSVLLRCARRNAHHHIRDLRQFAVGEEVTQ